MFAYTLLCFAPLTCYTVFQLIGTRRDGGYRKPFASIIGRVRGRRTPATATTAGCSSPSTPGSQWVGPDGRTYRVRASSCTGHGSFIDVTATAGLSGERPALVGFDE